MKVIRKFIIEFSESEKAQVDKFIELNDGLIFHETRFNEIASETFNTDLFYFLAYKDKRLVGICPVHSIKRGILSNIYSNNGSFEIPYGGWVFDNKYTSFQRLWNNLPIHINQSLTLWTNPLLNLGMKPLINKNAYNFYTGFINLGSSIEDIWNTVLKSELRNKVKRAQKNEIVIQEMGTESVDIFYDLLLQRDIKTKMQSKPILYYKKIMETYSPEKAKILFSNIGGSIISGLFIIGNRNAVHFWQGASIIRLKKNLYQNELLHWEAIKWAKSRNSRYYDLCVIEPERLPQIAQFKMGFTKDLIPFFCIHKKSIFFRTINKLQNVFTI